MGTLYPMSYKQKITQSVHVNDPQELTNTIILKYTNSINKTPTLLYLLDNVAGNYEYEYVKWSIRVAEGEDKCCTRKV